MDCLSVVFLLIFLSFSTISLELLLGVSTNNHNALLPIAILSSITASALFTAVILFPTKEKVRLIIGVFVLLLNGMVFTLETALFRSLGYFYPLTTVLGMGGAVLGSYRSTVLNSVISILPFAILYQIPTAIFILFRKRLLKSGIKPKPLRTVSLLLVFSFAVNSGVLSHVRASSDLSYLYNEGYEFNEAVKAFGLYSAFKLEAKNSIFPDPHNTLPDTINHTSKDTDPVLCNVTPALNSLLERNDLPETVREINERISRRSPSEKNVKSGLFEGKNLIFICAEALSPYAISEKLTPTLYKMTSEGFTFSNYYTPTFGESTSGGEYSLLLSQIPKRTSGEKGLSMQLIAKNNLAYSMPSLFRSHGYLCNGYHNNSYTYYNRNITHPALGLNWYGCGGCVTVDNEAEKIDLAHLLSGGWPRSDRELIQQTAERFINASKEKDCPFFTYYLTVSGHNNYSFKGNKISAQNTDYVKDLNCSDTVKSYLAAQKELDLALEDLLNILNDNKVLNDTVIVISNDHHPYGLSSTWAGNKNIDYLSELYGKKTVGKTEIEKGFFTVYCHGVTNETIDTPISSLDVLPTLLNLFGIEYDSRVLCGKDAFAPGERLVFFSDGSFITEKITLDKNRTSETVRDKSYVERIKLEIRELTQLSLALRKNDYFSYLDE